MPCCVPDLLYTLPLSLAREYNSDLGVDHWTAVKIILSGIRIYFSIMDMTKRFIVKGYVDSSFNTDPNDSNLNLDTYLKWEQLTRVALCRALLT